jgi:hypothetical protein
MRCSLILPNAEPGRTTPQSIKPPMTTTKGVPPARRFYVPKPPTPWEPTPTSRLHPRPPCLPAGVCSRRRRDFCVQSDAPGGVCFVGVIGGPHQLDGMLLAVRGRESGGKEEEEQRAGYGVRRSRRDEWWAECGYMSGGRGTGRAAGGWPRWTGYGGTSGVRR